MTVPKISCILFVVIFLKYAFSENFKLVFCALELFANVYHLSLMIFWVENKNNRKDNQRQVFKTISEFFSLPIHSTTSDCRWESKSETGKLTKWISTTPYNVHKAHTHFKGMKSWQLITPRNFRVFFYTGKIDRLVRSDKINECFWVSHLSAALFKNRLFSCETLDCHSIFTSFTPNRNRTHSSQINWNVSDLFTEYGIKMNKNMKCILWFWKCIPKVILFTLERFPDEIQQNTKEWNSGKNVFFLEQLSSKCTRCSSEYWMTIPTPQNKRAKKKKF